MDREPKPLAFTLPDVCRIAGIGMTTAYSLIGAGVLDARKAGRRTIVTAASLDAYLASLPKATVRAPRQRKAA